ncbi:MAG: NUDIX domain-containing protein [Endozoicomonadaceae bacterium]|nr:NUDIX domain-containing protein [Endozoicomonadaceae bacterium]
MTDSYQNHNVVISRKETLFNGFFSAVRYYLKHTLFQGGWSKLLAREVLIRHSAAGVLLYDPLLDNVILVEQFRVGVFVAGEWPWIMEVVAGMLDAGETPEVVARREAMEEAGCEISTLRPITHYFSTPGVSSERIWLFCGLTDSRNAGGIYGLDAEDEDIRVHVLSAEEAFKKMAKDETNNAATIISLQWLYMNRPSIRSQYA